MKKSKTKYIALHRYIYKKLGNPQICWKCKTKKAKKYEWANKSGKYTKILSDWIRLCTKCHIKFDQSKNRGIKKENPCKCGKPNYGNGLCALCYQQTEKQRKYQKQYRNKKERKEYMKKYNKEYKKTYNKTEKYKKYQKQYKTLLLIKKFKL